MNLPGTRHKPHVLLKIRKGVLIMLCFTCFAVRRPGGSFAQEVEPGARPLGMGGAFVAVADDGNASFWNPAGLALLQGLDVNSMYADLFAAGIEHNFLGAALPVRNWGSVGLAWSRIGYDDSELSYGENQLLCSYGILLWRGLSVGLNTKLLRTDAEFEGLNSGTASGWGYDAGCLYQAKKRFHIGCVLRDIGDTRVTYDTGHSASVMNQSFSAGAAFQFSDRLLLAGEADDRLHWGAEYWLSDGFAVRAGLVDDIRMSEPLTWSYGAGFRFRMVQLDYAYVDVPTLPATHRFSCALRFTKEEPWVRIEGVQLDDLFAAQYRYYEDHPLGMVRVVNVSARAIAVKGGVEFNHLTDDVYSPDRTHVLNPGEAADIPLHAIFNPTISDAVVDRTVQGNVKVVCSADGEHRQPEVQKSQETNLYGRNAVRWDDVRKAASFIEPKDKSVRAMTSRALELAAEPIAFLPENLLHAMTIFDLLGEYGLTYIPDPETPYSTAGRLNETIDHIQYPAETLVEKRGDCDDFVVLYASCLENIGIPTALVDVPGHLLLAFALDSQSPPDMAGFDERSSLHVNGRAWIPVETTLQGRPFHQAWEEGAAVLERGHDGVRIIEVDEAWRIYPSNEIDVGKEIPAIAATGKDLFDQDVQYLKKQKLDRVLEKFTVAPGSEDRPDSIFGDIGVELGRAGLFTEAIDYLLRAYQADSTLLFILNNLGVAYSSNGQYENALRTFQKALSFNPDDADLHLNLACLFYEMGDLERARQEYEEAVRLNPDFKGSLDVFEEKGDLQKKRDMGSRRMKFMWK